jgi:hypothetical protein
MLGISPNGRMVRNIDIAKRPNICQFNGRVDQLVFGDMHGNTLKLVHLLTLHGYFEALTSKEYVEIKNIYYTDPSQVTDEQVARLKTLFNKVQQPKEVGNLLLLGDLFSDRGMNDVFTALLFGAMHNNKVQCSGIPISNHDLDLLGEHERIEKKHAPARLMMTADRDQINSAAGAKALMESRTNTFIQKDFNTLLSEAFIPRLALMSYLITDDKIQIYTHAPIPWPALLEVFEECGYELPQSFGVGDLAKAIDGVNLAFQGNIRDQTKTPFRSMADTDSAQFQLAWSRVVDAGGVDAYARKPPPDFVAIHHGHSTEESPKQYCSYDDNVGKTDGLVGTKYTAQCQQGDVVVGYQQGNNTYDYDAIFKALGIGPDVVETLKKTEKIDVLKRYVITLDLNTDALVSNISDPEKRRQATAQAKTYKTAVAEAGIKCLLSSDDLSTNIIEFKASLKDAEKTFCAQALNKETAFGTFRRGVAFTTALLANFVFVLPTLGLVNYSHYKNTGNVLFFSHTKSATKLGEQKRILANQLSPKPDA